jgi:hypothetical protein
MGFERPRAVPAGSPQAPRGSRVGSRRGERRGRAWQCGTLGNTGLGTGEPETVDGRRIYHRCGQSVAGSGTV